MHSERAEAVKVTCCPPPAGQRPPCPTCPPNPPLTCSKRKFSTLGSKQNSTQKSCIPKEPVNKCSDSCGNENDRVERRLQAEEQVRREDYEREVSERKQPCEPPARAQYCLGNEFECATATDGRQYAVLCGKETPVPRCGPGRRPPPPQCVELIADGPCTIQEGNHMDPCAHRPRTLVQIDRSHAVTDNTAINMAKKVDDIPAQTISKQQCDKKCDVKSCEIKISKPPPAQPCRQPTVTESLRERGPGPCSYNRPGQPQTRSLHTLARKITPTKRKELFYKNRKDKLCTNKLLFSSTPDVKIVMMNRATSPLVKLNSANFSNGSKKSGSWASFEKLRKVCEGFSGKKNENKTNISKNKVPPPCGCNTETTMITERLPPNPCVLKRPTQKQSKTSDTKSNQASANPCSPKPPKVPKQSTKSPCRESRPTAKNDCALKQTTKSSCAPTPSTCIAKNAAASKQTSCNPCNSSPKPK
nr:unnamed protein product [Amyelois transitella]